MKKASTILAIIFFLNTLFLIYVFVFRGGGVELNDNRVAIELNESNTKFALKEMRGEVVERVPKGMMASLPIGFKKLVSS
jgi:hypothetical protein